jgi:hypothetical protein
VVAEELDLVRALGGITGMRGEVDDNPPAGWGGVQ